MLLIAVCCDHPAMCKVSGFADHKHKRHFCSKCHIRHTELYTPAGMIIDRTSRLGLVTQHPLIHLSEFPHRDGNNHTRRARDWKDLEEDERKDFFNEHGAHYFELSRLSYFDPVRMSVIDPMHNILLGQFIFQSAVI